MTDPGRPSWPLAWVLALLLLALAAELVLIPVAI